jgi:hypothetical protein
MRLTINSKQSLSKAIGQLRETFAESKFFTLTISTGKKRSLLQNSLFHSWCGQVADEEREYSAGEVKCLVKLNIGLPILRGADEEVNATAHACVDVLPYENKVEAMRFFPITSLMKTNQLAEMLEQMHAHYAGRVDLRFPDDD